MYSKKSFIRFAVLALSLPMLALLSSCETMGMKKSTDSEMMKSSESGMTHSGNSMTMHHQHEAMNHALSMVLDGSDLVMLGQMGMVPGVDRSTVEHGKMMMNNGTDYWNKIMSGDTMMTMHKAGTTPMNDPVMKYTHELGEAQLKVISLLKKHADMKSHTMGMHHQHILMNHALKMSLEASDMIMTGQMNMAPGVDDAAVAHGKKMRKTAWNMLNEVLSGDAMMTMHEGGMKPTSDKGMAFTHEIGSSIMKVMSLLDKMP